jgi:hypothetical protein
MRAPRLHWLGPVGTHDEGVDGTGATLMKIGALFFAAAIFAGVAHSRPSTCVSHGDDWGTRNDVAISGELPR